jgi:hypothetical protein
LVAAKLDEHAREIRGIIVAVLIKFHFWHTHRDIDNLLSMSLITKAVYLKQINVNIQYLCLKYVSQHDWQS